MRLRTPATTHVGDAIDLRESDTSLTPADLFDAVCRSERTESDDDASRSGTPESDAGDTTDLAVDCPAPGPLHRFVGLLDGRPVRSRRRLLALAARSRGASAPQDDAIRDLRAELADCSPPSLDLAALRRRVAEVGQRESDLRERAATLRGELSALREVGADTDDVAGELADVTADLAEVETDRIAAEQALADAERRAREARDARERRLELQDALANRRREARRHLADRVARAVDAAEETVPGRPGDATTTRLAVVRVADVEAPVVLAVERFESAEHANRVLDAPVVRV
jgi:cell division septum initiation protein DivIVA